MGLFFSQDRSRQNSPSYRMGPHSKQMRPILVCSALQKLLEEKFLPKLIDYLKNKLTASQVGFVPGMGIQVDILRAICVIGITTIDKNQHRYGLFIDFANAYNNVLDTLLFKKLKIKKCMSEDEIEYLEALSIIMNN